MSEANESRILLCSSETVAPGCREGSRRRAVPSLRCRNREPGHFTALRCVAAVAFTGTAAVAVAATVTSNLRSGVRSIEAEGIGVLFFANDSYRYTDTTGLAEMLLGWREARRGEARGASAGATRVLRV